MTDLFPAQPTNPDLTADEVRAVLHREWNIDGVPVELGSMQDQNFRVQDGSETRVVAKVAGAHTVRVALELQNAALRHLAEHRDGFTSPEPLATMRGHDILEDAEGHHLRVLTWIDGIPLSERIYVGPDDLSALGALAARVARGFDRFSHPGLELANGWDLRLAADVLAESRPYVPSDWVSFLDDAITRLGDLDPDLPTAVIHGDVTPVNAVCLPEDGLRSYPIGVLDFGDVMRSWRIGDVAATAVGALEHPGTGDSLSAALSVLAGYHSVLPLTEPEIDAFWPLVIARTAVTTAISYRQWVGNALNNYAQGAVATGLRAMAKVREIRCSVARAAARQAVGLAATSQGSAVLDRLFAMPRAALIDGLDTATPVDLSAEAEQFAYGEWSDDTALSAMIGEDFRIGRWGEARIVGPDRPSLSAPETLHLGVDVFASAGTDVCAPVAGRIVSADANEVLLDVAAGVTLRVSGVTPSGRLDAELSPGDSLGVIAKADGLLPAHVHVQLLLDRDVPCEGQAAHRAALLALSPDPSRLLGIDAAASPVRDGPAEWAHRAAVVGSPQHLYYDRPPEIVRGWRHHLYDDTGRCHLDMINNIAAIGHSHPAVVAAATRQLRRLNTNSRFLYKSMTDYAERIVALLPPELDSVLLVNSGSEAADLALQLARRYTGRRDLVVLAGAYHGWTGSVIDVSTSPMDRPNWRAELPPHVHVAEQPDYYRGAFGDAAEPYRASVRAACAAADGGPAAFLCEPLLGNQGALELPRGYLHGVYADVRAAGGLCIADEVQVGMARTGDTFWAFEHEGVVPDIVFTAKATGNGHPLGVVACRREIADSFDRQTSFFSSTGGGPVSCAIGLAVLDTIRDERLQENARLVGAHLKQRILELAESHALIGAVHGRGLYQGIDLVLDRQTKQPARHEALAISERLRTLGVIMQPTGDAFNVLKVKPPMCLDLGSADYFVNALDVVLTELT